MKQILRLMTSITMIGFVSVKAVDQQEIEGEEAENNLISCWKTSDLDGFKNLLDHGNTNPNITITVNRKVYPLVMRVSGKFLDALLDNDSTDINATNGFGDTSLMRASFFGNSFTVKKFIDHGADINIANNEKRTALMDAVWKGHTRIVKLLLTVNGIDLDAKDNHKETALDKAKFKGFNEIINILKKKMSIADEDQKEEPKKKEKNFFSFFKK